MVLAAPLVAAEILGVADIPKMHETYDRNEARFFRDYRGRSFSGTMTFADIKEDVFSRGTYNVFLKTPHSAAFLGDVECHVADENGIQFVTDLDKGQVTPVDGVVSDHEFGAIVLSDCRFPVALPPPRR